MCPGLLKLIHIVYETGQHIFIAQLLSASLKSHFIDSAILHSNVSPFVSVLLAIYTFCKPMLRESHI